MLSYALNAALVRSFFETRFTARHLNSNPPAPRRLNRAEQRSFRLPFVITVIRLDEASCSAGFEKNDWIFFAAAGDTKEQMELPIIDFADWPQILAKES